MNYDLIVDEIIKMSILNKDNQIKKGKNNIKEINLIDELLTKKIIKHKNRNNYNNNLNLDIQNFFLNPIKSGTDFDENMNSHIYQENQQNNLSFLNNSNVLNY